MNTTAMETSSRQLPSVDWIALVLAITGLILSHIPSPGWSSWIGLLGFAVFGPPLLREFGILNDEDEYTRDIRWRSGFHAALALAVLVFLNKILYPLIASHPEAMARKIYFFPPDYLRQFLVLVFLISFLIQYWEPVKGVFKILLGLGFLVLIEIFPAFLTLQDDQTETKLMYFIICAGLVAVFTAMAFLSRKKPRISGYLLLLSGIIISGFLIKFLIGYPDEPYMTGRLNMQLGIMRSTVMIMFVLGSMGVSLLRADRGNGQSAI